MMKLTVTATLFIMYLSIVQAYWLEDNEIDNELSYSVTKDSFMEEFEKILKCLKKGTGPDANATLSVLMRCTSKHKLLGHELSSGLMDCIVESVTNLVKCCTQKSADVSKCFKSVVVSVVMCFI